MKKQFLSVYILFLLSSCFSTNTAVDVNDINNIDNTGSIQEELVEDDFTEIEELRISGDYDTALTKLQEIEQSSSDLSGVYKEYGLVYHLMEDYGTAIEYFQKAISEDESKNPYTYFNLAVAYDNLGEVEESKEYLKKAIDIIPNEELFTSYTYIEKTEVNTSNFYREFDTAIQFYQEAQYDKVKSIFDELIEVYGENEELMNELRNHEVGLLYFSNQLGQQKDINADVFEQIQNLYNLGEYVQLEMVIKDFIELHGDTEAAKDFLNNTEIGKEYVSKQLGKNKGTELEEIFNQMNQIHLDNKASGSTDYTELAHLIDKLIATYGRDHPAVSDFLNNTIMGQAWVEASTQNQ